jgi:hypothetical protein
LWNAAGSRRNSYKLKFSQTAVLPRDLALALENVDLYSLLIIDDGCKRHRILDRNRSVAADELHEEPAPCLEAEA